MGGLLQYCYKDSYKLKQNAANLMLKWVCPCLSQGKLALIATNNPNEITSICCVSKKVKKDVMM